MSNWHYQEQKNRIQQEIEIMKAINEAGGSLDGFDLHGITEFLYACQCNNIEIFRDGTYGAYHIKYTPYRELDEKGIQIIESEKNRANAKLQQAWHKKSCPMMEYLRTVERYPDSKPAPVECNCKEK